MLSNIFVAVLLGLAIASSIWYFSIVRKSARNAGSDQAAPLRTTLARRALALAVACILVAVGLWILTH